MDDRSIETVQLHCWLEGLRAGDRTARDELLRAFCGQLEGLARKMLRRFPNVKRWADTGDVFQGALLRLLRSLEKVEPGSVREFLGLAALEMRRELLDLARRFHGPRGIGANQDSIGDGVGSEPASGSDDLDRWQAFHEGVEGLPVEEREVVGLVFYHGMTQAEVALILNVSERTVRRWWEAALVKLQRRVNPPGQGG